MSDTPSPAPKRLNPALIGGGILVIALGFGLPMLTSGTLPEASPTRETGAKQAPPAPIQPPAATGLGASLLKLAVGLAVVCGLCVLVAKWMGQKSPTSPGAMEVVASIAVGPCVVHLVRAGERRLLVGTDLGGVKALVEMPGPAPDAAPESPAAVAETPASTPAPHPTPTPAAPVTQEEILRLLLQLRTRTGPSSPG